MEKFDFFPEQASTIAPHIDGLYFGLIALSSFFILGIGAAALYFLIKYRRGSDADRSNITTGNWWIEGVWIAVPFVMAMGFFYWSANRYFEWSNVPENAVEVFVLGKQWMWKLQHPQGPREINTLHVPVDQPVVLKMTSQDVIHSFYVPAFRIKQDVVPGQYSTVWFEATKVGRYKLLCTEYCGTDHSQMRGEVIVMNRADFADWLSGGEAEASLADRGEQIYSRAGCSGCHAPDSPVEAPDLAGVYNSQVRLESGETVVADENYLRTSILQPQQQIVAGYEPLMPSFQGQLSESQIIELIEYIKSLGEGGVEGQGAPSDTTPPSPQPDEQEQDDGQ